MLGRWFARSTRTHFDTMGTLVHVAELLMFMLADSHARNAIQIDANGLPWILTFLDTVRYDVASQRLNVEYYAQQ